MAGEFVGTICPVCGVPTRDLDAELKWHETIDAAYKENAESYKQLKKEGVA